MFKKLFLLSALSLSLNANQIVDLNPFERGVYSQNGEDGVLEKIFDTIGTESKFYVEFGVESGVQCNTRFLKEQYGWQGLLMDGGYSNFSINLQQEMVTAENINALFEKYRVPSEFDLLSIDIDYNDFYVWHALSDYYRPRVVVIEYNATHLPHEDKVIVYDATGSWDRTNYFGASILAFLNLARKKGYSLVYAENRGVNLFFIRDDLLEEVTYKDMNNVEKIYKRARYGHGPNGGHPMDVSQRPYLKSVDLLSDD